MKKVCFVDYDMAVTGGAEQVTVSLANEFCKKYDIYIYSINDTGDIAYDLDERIHYYKELKGVTRLRHMMTGVFTPLCKLIKKEKIDTVIMMGNYPALIVSACRFFTKAKFIYCDHGALMNQWHQKDVTLIRLWNSIISHKVVTLTEQTKADYIRKFHIKKSKVQCIYNWIDPKLLQLNRSYNLESKKILTVGRFGKEKGYDLLLEVAKKVLPEHKEWQWHLYGKGEMFEATKLEIQRIGLEKQLILKGNVKEVYKLFNEYAFIVLPSYREGLPLVLLEASACGLPMVSFDVMTGPNEIIVENVNGHLIKPYDCDKMASCISELINDKERRNKLSEGTNICLKKFSYDRILKEWETILNM